MTSKPLYYPALIELWSNPDDEMWNDSKPIFSYCSHRCRICGFTMHTEEGVWTHIRENHGKKLVKEMQHE